MISLDLPRNWPVAMQRLLTVSALALGLVMPAAAQTAPDLTQDPTLYMVATAHLDDQWNWTIQTSINSYLASTLHDNFTLFGKYPHYAFSFEESFRYKLFKEYYPADYVTLTNYIAQGRWKIAGSSVVAGDVNVPSPESLIRGTLYANRFWRTEYGVTNYDLFLPDCFGFPYSLPSIVSHCGLKGFSTQKLQAKPPAIPIPFPNLGRWVGVDGSSIVASLQPGSYHTTLTTNVTANTNYINRVMDMGLATGLFVDYAYFGQGDVGGAPDDASVKWLEQSVTTSDGPMRVLSTGSDQIFKDLTPDNISHLPVYEGELLLKNHAAGTYTAHSELKQYNRQNEQRAQAAEASAVISDWLQGGGYPREKLTRSWERFLASQFHDDLPGTSIDAAYNFCWNDELLSLSEFGSIEKYGVGVIARSLDTTATGVPVVVYNPLSTPRQDIVETTVSFSGAAPSVVRVFDATGNEVPSQMGVVSGNIVPVTFLATVPAIGAATFDVRSAATASSLPTGLSVSTSQLENARYRVQLNADGDVSSIFDKVNNRELLKAPIRWGMTYDLSTAYPAWELLYPAVTGTPAYLGGRPVIEVAESGPARVGLKITRSSGGSTFTEHLSLAAGDAGNRVEWNVSANWQTRKTLLKVAFPMTVSNTNATYDLGIGVIQRVNNSANQYEVPAQQWADLTDADGSYGVTLMSDSKYGWDKPDNGTLRLTIFHTPDPGTSSYGSYQQNVDIGSHQFAFALMGHTNDWRAGGSCWESARMNQPLQAFQTVAHSGALGKSFTFFSCDNSNVMVKALKKSEVGNEIVVRLQELTGSAQTAKLSFASPIISARQITGVEDTLTNLVVANGKLTVSLARFQPVSVAVTLASPSSHASSPGSLAVALPFNVDVISTDAHRTNGNFDSGYSYPAELMPSNIVSEGITFQMGPTNDGASNAVSCVGQTISLNTAGYDRLYLLAAAATNDVTGTFTFDSQATNLSVGYFSGFYGQWNSPSLKQDELGWIFTHRHTGAGANDAYRFCYFYKYSLPIPAGTTKIILPNLPNLRIFAMTLTTNSMSETTVAGGALAASSPAWANAGTNQSLTAGSAGSVAATLSGSASKSAGTILSYTWSEAGLPLATGINPTVQFTKGPHLVLLTIVDDRGGVGQATVTINVDVPSGSGVWTSLASGSWIADANWQGKAIASGIGQTADFGTLALSSNLAVTLDGPRTIGNLNLNDLSGAGNSWTISSTSDNPLTLNVASGVPTLTIATPVTLALPLAGTSGLIKVGGNALTLTGANTYSGTTLIGGGIVNYKGNASSSGNGVLNVGGISGKGLLNISTTGTLGYGGSLSVGGIAGDTTDTGSGAINQSSGTLNTGTSGNYLELGAGGTSAYGWFQLSGGTLNVLNASGLRVGAKGMGVYRQTGGTLSCTRWLAVGTTTGSASSSGALGEATFTGGTASISSTYRIILGDKPSSVGVLNIGTLAGGTASLSALYSSAGSGGVQFLGDNAASAGILNLNAGTLQLAASIYRNTANTTGSAFVNLNGGTLQAGADNVSFINSTPMTVTVFNGGVVVDTMGLTSTLAVPLRAASGSGIYPAFGSFVVTNCGSGYLGAPLVALTGGSGSNLTAIANISNGVLSSLALTCPGQGYKAGDILSAIFQGGGATVPASFSYTLKAADLLPNTAGGLAKSNSGTLVLSATNTYSGQTVINGGTLSVTGQLLGSSPVLVNSGAALNGTGLIAGPVIVNKGGTLSLSTVGNLSITNALTLMPGATTVMSVNKTSGTNAQIQGVKQMTFGGTLVVTNLGAAIVAGDSFKLFNAESYSGAFDAIAPIAPSRGLIWDSSMLKTNGTLKVVSMKTTPTKLSVGYNENSYNLSWPVDCLGWRLEFQTNDLLAGLKTNWMTWSNSYVMTSVTVPSMGYAPCSFFRLVYP